MATAPGTPAVQPSPVRLGAVSPQSLVAARETAHHAAQLLALVGASFIDARPDDGHTSMSWGHEHQALITQPVNAPSPFRVALRIADLTLLVLDDAGAGALLSLPGQTRAAALEWLRHEIAARGRDPVRLRSSLHFSIEPHPTDRDGAFEHSTDGAFDELGRWYDGAAAVLEAVRRDVAGAGPVLCWPHHFDIATLITRPAGTALTTIGVGMSPGDGSYAEPYYYVGPYPSPTSTPSPLAVGHWHTIGWWGGVLLGSEVVVVREARAQVALVRRFLDGAMNALIANAGDG